MEGELIYVAIIMQIGTLITILLWSNTSLRKYFAKENFKTGLANVRAENRLNLKKLEKDLGLGSVKSQITPTTPPSVDKLGLLSQLAPLLSKLDGDQLGILIDKFVGGEELTEIAEGAGGILDSIPPELIKSFLEGIQKGNVGGDEGGVSNAEFTAQG